MISRQLKEFTHPAYNRDSTFYIDHKVSIQKETMPAGANKIDRANYLFKTERIRRVVEFVICFSNN